MFQSHKLPVFFNRWQVCGHACAQLYAQITWSSLFCSSTSGWCIGCSVAPTDTGSPSAVTYQMQGTRHNTGTLSACMDWCNDRGKDRSRTVCQSFCVYMLHVHSYWCSYSLAINCSIQCISVSTAFCLTAGGNCASNVQQTLHRALHPR